MFGYRTRVLSNTVRRISIISTSTTQNYEHGIFMYLISYKCYIFFFKRKRFFDTDTNRLVRTITILVAIFARSHVSCSPKDTNSSGRPLRWNYGQESLYSTSVRTAGRLSLSLILMLLCEHR